MAHFYLFAGLNTASTVSFYYFIRRLNIGPHTVYMVSRQPLSLYTFH